MQRIIEDKASAAAVHSAGCYSREHKCCQPGCQQYHARHRIHHDQPVRRPVDLQDSLEQTACCQRRDSGKPCIQSRPSREKIKAAVLPVPVLFIEGLRFFKINDLQFFCFPPGTEEDDHERESAQTEGNSKSIDHVKRENSMAEHFIDCAEEGTENRRCQADTGIIKKFIRVFNSFFYPCKQYRSPLFPRP